MPKAPMLTEFEQGKILAYKESNMSVKMIANKIGRSRKVISNFMKYPVAYGAKKHTGRKPTLTPNDERRLLREAFKGILSANEVRISLELKVSTKRVQQKLQGCPHLKFEKMKKSPILTIKHKEARIKFTKDHVDHGSKWDQVIFSDEKNFTLDGPDGFHSHWRDLRKDPRVLSKRQSGGGSLIVWGAFSEKGKSELVILTGNQNAEKYVSILESYLLSFGHLYYGCGFEFQQNMT